MDLGEAAFVSLITAAQQAGAPNARLGALATRAAGSRGGAVCTAPARWKCHARCGWRHAASVGSHRLAPAQAPLGLNDHFQHAARHRGVANPPEEGQPAVGEQRRGYELGWLARAVVLGCVRIEIARSHGHAPWNLGQRLVIEVIDQGISCCVPPGKVTRDKQQ